MVQLNKKYGYLIAEAQKPRCTRSTTTACLILPLRLLLVVNGSARLSGVHGPASGQKPSRAKGNAVTALAQLEVSESQSEPCNSPYICDHQMARPRWLIKRSALWSSHIQIACDCKLCMTLSWRFNVQLCFRETACDTLGSTAVLPASTIGIT
jgi:hypothetical protein